MPLLQFGDSVKGTYTVKNTGDPSKSTGFYPSVVLSVDPLHKEVVQRSKLVFAGRSRESNFEIPSSRFGFYKVSASFGENRQEQWVFVVNSAGLAICGLIVAAIGGLVFWRKKLFHKSVDNLRINR